jgi:cytochrome P450
MRKGDKATFFTRSFLDNQERYQLSDDEGAYVVSTLFEAGSGTTAAAMMSFCLAILQHPEWQIQMQAELDRVVGDGMPGFEDRLNLPTVRAVIKEVLRWRPVTAGGVPHLLTQDDSYDAYFFAKGRIVFHANQWAIHRDSELYPAPESFRPERWLSPDFPTTYRESLTKFPNLQNYSCFGFGTRICPGQNIAERSMNILTARIAWAATLCNKKDAEGKTYNCPGTTIPEDSTCSQITSISMSCREQSREPTKCLARSNRPGRAGKPRAIQLMEREFLEGPRSVSCVTHYP